VASRTEGRGDGTKRGEKPLGVPWRLTPLHGPLPWARRLRRVLRTGVAIAVLTVLLPRLTPSLRRPLTLQLLRNDDARHVREPLEELLEEVLGNRLIAPALELN
jgi:hypothetical protein